MQYSDDAPGWSLAPRLARGSFLTAAVTFRVVASQQSCIAALLYCTFRAVQDLFLLVVVLLCSFVIVLLCRLQEMFLTYFTSLAS